MTDSFTFLTDCNLPDNVSNLFMQLNSKIMDLDSQIGKVLQVHENEFLTAYKIHMLDIQKEMKLLRQSITQEELKRKRDDEIIARERERDWFREEALRLDKICKEHAKCTDIWKSKAKMLEGDKKMLEEKIKKLKIKPSVNQSHSVSPMPNLSNSKITESATTLKANSSLQNLSIENTINHLQKELKTHKTWVRKLRSETTSIISSKHSLEKLFLECVETVKNEVKCVPLAQLDIATDPLETFSEPEKRKILYYLIAKPEVTELLRSYLFKSKKSNTPCKLILNSNISTHGLSSHVFSTPKKRPRLRHLPYYH